MLKDVMVIDDVFENPHQIREFANLQTFYNNENFPYDKSSHGEWSGLRTKRLYELDFTFFQDINNQLIDKSLFYNQPKFNAIRDYSWICNSYFHRLEESDKFEKSWEHVDNTYFIYAAVVYLQPNANTKNGTVIYKNGEKIEIENIFNRAVIYRSDYLHHACDGFGFGENSRLTYTTFFSNINIELKHI
jgi:hypothetical protein